jgi:hypothetical protein
MTAVIAAHAAAYAGGTKVTPADAAPAQQAIHRSMCCHVALT